MNSPLVQCPECRGSLLDGVFNQSDLVPCPTCGVPLQIELFPAFFRRISPGRDAEAVMIEGESSCFYHPAKKAVVPCDACGRFLCALCDCELNAKHYCPGCLETGKSKGKIKNLENRRTLNDSTALMVAFVPFFGPPVSLFLAIRYWNAPTSVVRRSKWRLILAIILSVLQIIGWVLIFAGV